MAKWLQTAAHCRPMEMPDYEDLSRRTQPRARLLQAYWRRTCRLTGVLLLLWALASFGLIYFARDLSFNFFGWPFGFWVASQGALMVFCLIVAFYAWAMGRLDAQTAALLQAEGAAPE